MEYTLRIRWGNNYHYLGEIRGSIEPHFWGNNKQASIYTTLCCSRILTRYLRANYREYTAFSTVSVLKPIIKQSREI